MQSKTIKPTKKFSGEIAMPGDKSISHRAVMLGSLAKGETRVRGLLDCDDCNYTIHAFQEMGVDIKKQGECTIINGNGLKGLKKPAGPISLGESGTSMRLIAGIAAGQDFEVTLTGDESLSRRPMKRIVGPLKAMGVDIKARDNDYIPLVIRGGAVRPIDYKMPVPSAQVKSAILFAGLYASGVTSVEEVFKSRDHTERMMGYFGADINVKGLKVSLRGGKELGPRAFEIPGDISSAAFFIAGATLLKGSRITIRNVGVNPTRTGIMDVLLRMGSSIKMANRRDLFEPVADIEVESAATSGTVIEKSEIPGMIDELPILFVVAALSKGKTVIKGAQELRVKETDRINSMLENLRAMGGKIELQGDTIMIEGVKALRGADIKTFADHRTCMSMTIAALTADGESRIDDIECVWKSFPGFFQVLDKLKG